MKSSRKSFDVFDFKEEDEFEELTSAKLITKFKNPSAIDEHKFLENGNLPCVGVDAIDNVQNCDNAVSCIPIGLEGEDPATGKMSGLDNGLLFNSRSHEQQPQFNSSSHELGSFSAELEPRASSPGAASPGIGLLNSAFQESPSTDESVDVISDADESMSGNSPSTSSDISGDDVILDGPLSDHCWGSWEMVDRNMAVISPDYVVYRGRYCTESVLIFSSNCIEMRGFGDHGTFSFQWGIDEIVDIESQWSEKLEMAMVRLRLIPKDAIQADDVQGTSGIEELKFAVVDSNWYEKQEQITSLDVQYKALWNVVSDTELGGDGEALPGQNGICLPKKRYLPNFDEPFEEVVYPKGDSDAVSICKRDVELLQPDTFVNDTIIDFYIKYLKNEMQPEERQRFHFFNSFFFRKLIDLDKDTSSGFEAGAAFQRVRKWTRKVNLFEKDYVFIPVNFNYHWSLIVICHPGEVSKFQDEDVEKSLRVPCILHMDSIKGTHTGLKDLVQSYLWEEWKERQKEASEDISSRFFNLRFVPLELPQQQNSFDCGLFLLHYVECFLGEAPLKFSPFKITKFSNFLNVDWFPPSEPSLKRVHIQALICEILERENSPAACSGKPCASNYPESNNESETGVDFVSERCSPSKSCHGNLSSAQAGQGIEITLLPTFSFRSSECASDSGLAFREYFEAGATAGSFPDGQYPTFDRAESFSKFKGAMSPIEEDVEAGGQFVFLSSNRTSFQQLAGVATEGGVFPYSSRDFGAETSWNQGISACQAVNEDIDASPETSICASDDSLEVEISENNIVLEDLSKKEKTDQPKSPSTENKECLTETLAPAPSEILDFTDSQHSDHFLDCNGNADGISCQNRQRSPLTENRECLTETLAPAPSEILDVTDSHHSDPMLDSNGNADGISCQNIQRSPSTENRECLTETLDPAPSEILDVADSQHSDHMLDSNGNADDLFTCPNRPRSASTENKGCLTDSLASTPSEMLDVADSRCSKHMFDSNGNSGDLVSCPNSPPGLSHQDCNVQENGDVACSDVRLIRDSPVSESDGQKVLGSTGNDLVSESDEQQASKRISDDSVSESVELQPAKRPRLTPPLEVERRLTRSLSKDQRL